MYPDLITPDSPTQKVGEQPLTGFKQVEHTPPMLSLDNTYSKDEVFEFDKRVQKWLGASPSYQVSLKVDGVAISIRYKDGKLDRGITRGDGQQGDDITENVKTIRSLPLRLLNISKIRDIIIRGEIYLPKKEFVRINVEKEKEGETQFANARNAAAGTLKHLNPKEVAGRGLEIFFHTIPEPADVLSESHYESMLLAQKAGLRIIPNIKLCKTINEVMDYIDEWQDKRHNLEFEVDGLVISVDNFSQRAELGSTSKAPRWSIAFKYPAAQAVTTLTDIITQVGRTGRVTPVAILKPVLLSGSTIQRATLHNEDEIKKLDIRIGDQVVIEKGGEVIPKVVEVVKEKRTGSEKKFNFPKICPVCGSKIHRLPDEADYRCPNSSCPAQLKRSILHFAARGVMDIDGLGFKLVNQLVDKEKIKNFADLYRLTTTDLEGLERMGMKSAKNLINSINKSKNQPLVRLLLGLGIRHVGAHAAQLLADRFGSIDGIASTQFDELASISGIGPVIAKSIINYFSDPKNTALIKELKKLGLVMAFKKKKKSNIWNEKSFVFTGELATITRQEAADIVRSLGGKVSSTVSKNTTYVVVGRNPGSKYQKAIALGTEIIDEEKFLQMTRRK